MQSDCPVNDQADQHHSNSLERIVTSLSLTTVDQLKCQDVGQELTKGKRELFTVQASDCTCMTSVELWSAIRRK